MIVTIPVLLLALGAVGFSLYKFAGIWGLIKVGKEQKLTDNPGKRFGYVFQYVFGHKKVMENKTSGAMHVFFLYGFLILGIGHTELVLTGITWFLKDMGMTPFFFSNFLPDILTHIYHFTQDFMAFAVIAISIFAIARRWSGRIKRLMPRSTDAEIILYMITALYVTFFLLWGTDFGMRMNGSHHLGFTMESGVKWYAPISTALGTYIFKGVGHGTNEILHWVGFGMHLLIFLGFACYIPLSKHMHLVWAGPNIYFHHTEPMGTPPAIDFMDENLEKYGIDRVDEYSWKTMLDTFACTECGRCNSVCPAHITGKPLKPKKVLHDLKENLRHHNKAELTKHRTMLGKIKSGEEEQAKNVELKVPLILRDEVDFKDTNQVDEYGAYKAEEGQIHLDTIWACTTCAACVEACPVLIDSVPGSLIALRQNLVMMEADFPEEMTNTFNGMERQGNPWGQGQDKREDWAEGEDIRTIAEVAEAKEEVDYLYWVGCAGVTDDNAKKTQKALVKILKKADVNFAIMGCGEKCTGDPARRMGNEYLFDALARENVENLNAKKDNFKKIFTACPHCFNSLNNEYPALGGDYEVHHHTQLLSQLVNDKKLDLSALETKKETVTYHDPCYLGRYNSVYDAPRELLSGLPGVTLKEMDLAREKSMCCGAGGGRVFMEEHIGTRVNHERTDQAVSTGASTVAVGCPFCTIMVTDGIKAKDIEDDLKVKDIAQMIAERMPN